MKDELLKSYARLVVKTGVNIQRGQTLIISSPIACAEFVRLVAETAYREGARDVVPIWKDELFQKLRYMNAPEEVFGEFPDWQRQMYISYAEKGAAFLSITAEAPGLMKEVEPKRIARADKARNIALEPYIDRIMNSRNAWCVAAVPTAPWAVKVFLGIPESEAVEKLWEAVLKAVRADAPDPVAAWERHKSSLKRSMDFLNSHSFKYLHYRNSLGTDLRVELPENHLWLGGSEFTTEGTEFIANLPTEEVFTLPKKTGVNGTVVSSMPLNYNGNLINGLKLVFKDGRIAEFTAEEGLEPLKNLIGTDEGSRYLGEVALVPVDSPIYRSKVLFYNTLFDENASCHLAIGRAYPCLKNGGGLSKAELEREGANDSLVHVDFMIGTEDLDITGITAQGEEIPVFVNGRFAY